MGLSRLDNFLKSTRGTILYVDPSSLDSTDSIENQGNSLTRPFKTIQRALIESARFSYQRGLDNDRFNKTTIVLYPGDHIVDNRPGYIPDGTNNFRLRSGATIDDLVPFDLNTNFDLTTTDNVLYKLNSIHGGVIIPRGTSIVGMDLRKTKIRPTYVPNPENDNIERSCVFRVTGGCYLWQFSVLDADPNGTCYKDYTSNIFVPNFSHHKLSAFEYADGVNNVNIDDDFQTYSSDRTDLDMYYEKVGIVYGQSSGRPISPDYPSSTLDIQPVVDEYRIVGSRGSQIGISSIKSGDGVTPTTRITVTLSSSIDGLNVDTPIRIEGVGSAGYDGQYVVSEVNSSSEIVYQVQNSPSNPLPSVSGATLNIAVDTVTSASPYIFNISLRSVYGMCGLLADGDKADGFKSMVVAQFTGIGLQKDDNAFVKYDSVSGTYKDATSYDNLHTDSLARFKPEYENFHIKSKNNSFIQLVSIFAIGYAQHFVSESGGDLSITNSNSNFGAKSLVASGFRKEAFPRDDIGYITHIIPPKEIETVDGSIEFGSIDVGVTTSASAGAASTSRLYLYNETNEGIPPSSVIDGYRIGAKQEDNLFYQFSENGSLTEYLAKIVMPNSNQSYQKLFTVGRSAVGVNSISSNVLTLTENHTFDLAESVRIISDNAHLPDGIENRQIYYVITSEVDGTLGSNQIKISQSESSAFSDDPVSINSNGGLLRVVSRVSDKTSGDIGHPIQWDNSQSNWYVNVSTASTENTIYSKILEQGTSGIGNATPRTYFRRKPDTRSIIDTVYRLRYVIPKDSLISGRPPLDAFILQESNNVIGAGTTEIQKYFDPTNSSQISNSTELRNLRFISDAYWSSNTANIITEIPHNLNVGSQVEIINVTSTNNISGVANSAYNGTFTVSGVSSSRHFSYSLTNDPGSFTNNVSVRDSNLPYFKRKRYTNTYQIYRSQEVKKYIPGKQDGVYYLVIINSSNTPTVSPFSSLKFSQPISNLYPQTNRDNPKSDPDAATCFANSDLIGLVSINDEQLSITKETINKELLDLNVGIGLSDIVSNSAGTAHTFYSSIDHGLAGITSVSITSGGSGYGFISGTAGVAYNARLVGFAGSTTGVNATASVVFNSSGTITSVKIMDGGSAYGIGNTLSIVGIATTTGHTQAVVTVTDTLNSLGETIQLQGTSESQYNTLYKVTGITVGDSKKIDVQSSVSVGSASTTGVGVTATQNSSAVIVGRTIGVSTFVYSPSVGIATFTFTDSHGLNVGNKVRFSGSTNSFFNGDFVLNKVNSLSSAVFNVGLGTTFVSSGGEITAYMTGISANGGDLTNFDENIGGRLIYHYAGITTSIGSDLADNASDATPLDILGADAIGLKLGDYVLVDKEIFRIKSDVTSRSVSVFRSLFGTKRETHTTGSVVRKINVYPIELRRNSIIRASGHTFEYVGFGPGNYSTALPERQDRIISPAEELIAQNTKIDGGVSIFTAMNSDGDFYTGNKKVNSSTGQEEVFDAPVPSVTGEEVNTGNISVGFDLLTPLEASISRSLRVEGGPEGNLVSEFDGPVIFNNKITSNSDKGIEAKSIFIQGDAEVSRNYTVGISTPTLSGNPGDVVYKSNPVKGDSLGWVYTTDNNWYDFGSISNEVGSQVSLFDAIGVATNSVHNYKVVVGWGTTSLTVSGLGSVGIGSTQPEQKVDVRGDVIVDNIISRGYVYGDGSFLTGLTNTTYPWKLTTVGIHTLDNVGIGTTNPIDYKLVVGNSGDIVSLAASINGQTVFNGDVEFNQDNTFNGAIVANDVSIFGSNVSISTSLTLNGPLSVSGLSTFSSLVTVGSSIFSNPTTGIVTAVEFHGKFRGDGSRITGYGSTVWNKTISGVTTTSNVGISTQTPRASLDIEGRTRLKSYFEPVKSVSSSGGVVALNLSDALNFTLSLSENVTSFTLSNVPDDAVSFTIAITQDSTPRTVTLSSSAFGGSYTIKWPGGSAPTVTTTAGSTDLFSFVKYGGTTWFGINGGQDFQ